MRFIQYHKADYRAQWYHNLICSKCEQAVKEGGKNLMIFTPPRHGKTEIVSRYLPAYTLGLFPNDSVIATSYSDTLAIKNNRDVQRIIDSNKYREVFPDTKLPGKHIQQISPLSYTRTTDYFEIVDKKGCYISAGVGGGITGMGFSRLGLIDDPVKNREEAESKTLQEKIFDWYLSTFLTRREKNASIIIIMTRWQKNDLAGKLLAVESDKWEVISLPAIMEHTYPHTHEQDLRQPGEELWPDEYPIEFLEQFKRNKYEWNALFQQLPFIRGGNLIKRAWFGLKEEHFPQSKRIRFWDLAGTPKEKSKRNDPDFTAGALVAFEGGNYVIEDIKCIRDSPKEVQDLIKKTAEEDQKAHGRLSPVLNVWEEEGGASGKHLSMHLNNLLAGYLRQPYRVGKAKEFYVDQLANKAETGNIQVLNAPWLRERADNETFFDEAEAFPKGSHDDRVDAVSKAVHLLTEMYNQGEYLDGMYAEGTGAVYNQESELF